MSELHNDLNHVLDSMIEMKMAEYRDYFNEKLAVLERQLLTNSTNPYTEILQQKEVFALLGIGRVRLKKWVERGLREIRIDNRVYYRYSDLMHFIEHN